MLLMKKLKERFSQFTIHDYLPIVCLTILFAFGLYFSISMSITIAKGLTLFGDSNTRPSGVETEGPTSADISVLSLIWILVVLLLVILIYLIFFKKTVKNSVTKKEVIDNKIIEIKQSTTDNTSLSDEAFLDSLSKLENKEKNKDDK